MRATDRASGLTFERVRYLLNYDPENGKFSWNVSRGMRKKGGVAGSLHHTGYWILTIDGRSYQSHRLAWFWMMGEWPPVEVDHINLNKSDNRWDNLRAVSSFAENQWNRPTRKDSATGRKWVWQQKSGRFSGRLSVNGRDFYVGIFDTAELAHEACCAKAEELCGQFARSE